MNLDRLLDAPLVAPAMAPVPVSRGWAPPLVRPAPRPGHRAVVAPATDRAPPQGSPADTMEDAALPERPIEDAVETDRPRITNRSPESVSPAVKEPEQTAAAIHPQRPLPAPVLARTTADQPDPAHATPDSALAPLVVAPSKPPTAPLSAPLITFPASHVDQVRSETVMAKTEVQPPLSATPAPARPELTPANGQSSLPENRWLVPGKAASPMGPTPPSPTALVSSLPAPRPHPARPLDSAPSVARAEEPAPSPAPPVALPPLPERRSPVELYRKMNPHPGPLPVPVAAGLSEPGPGPTSPVLTSPASAAPSPRLPSPVLRPPEAARLAAPEKVRSPIPTRPVASAPVLRPAAASLQARTPLPSTRNPMVVQNTSSLGPTLSAPPIRPLPPPKASRLVPPPAAVQRPSLPTPAPDPVEVHIGHFEIRPPPAPVVTQRASATHRIPVSPPGLGRW